MRFAIDADFQPPRWLRNPHVQSVLPSIPLRRPPVLARARALLERSSEVLLDCGDGVRLQCFHASPVRAAGRAAVLLHGWEGNADALYVLSLGEQLLQRGFEVVRLNLRDHGATHHLNRELFHSCRLPEVVGAVRSVQSLFVGHPLHLVGFSLGGNFMLRVAAQACDSHVDIAHVTAVSPVLEPADTLASLTHGFHPYHRYFVRRWLGSLRKKQAAWPRDYDFSGFERVPDLRKMTAELVERFTEFPSLDDYLSGYALTGARLARLTVPATVITALDDPIIPPRGLERLAQTPALSVVLTRYGGHCGFLDSFAGPSWAERRILAELDGSLASRSRGASHVA